MRDSKRRTGPVLVFRRTAWCGLLTGLENPGSGRFLKVRPKDGRGPTWGTGPRMSRRAREVPALRVPRCRRRPRWRSSP
ncbi:DUF397 domain-containing protein [Streptomyces chiangmaiensis]|uniref:DUF397 domain-containing protein n=1 Tax=Streptomyces chiangmaiensis TaxID=766497 RepID=A0ABU7FDZ6_9ACTN|nr:DUF397 domain-containing protein [Streptomyces chiangmaiensis]MED7822305.1 DUF397 domain-containing protein [Streptomyces chiangmaiensis]